MFEAPIGRQVRSASGLEPAKLEWKGLYRLFAPFWAFERTVSRLLEREYVQGGPLPQIWHGAELVLCYAELRILILG